MASWPKHRIGQKDNPIQVIGTSTITGFITLPMYFNTKEAAIQLTVETHVVSEMTMPFILGIILQTNMPYWLSEMSIVQDYSFAI